MFGMIHRDVVRRIRLITEEFRELSGDMFIEDEYIVRGHKYTCYNLTKNGILMLFQTRMFSSNPHYAEMKSKIFSEYEVSRKPNADAIAELSRRNFVEMSAKTADTNFLLQKKIEKWFSDKHPEKWMPLYSRVTFSLQPYSEAMAIGDFQNEIMQEVLKMDNIHENWNSEEVENKILELLK